MKIKELFNVWLHKSNPNSEIKVWSRNKIDYIFSTQNSDKYDLTADQVENMEVGCFYEYYDEEKEMEVLVINVD